MRPLPRASSMNTSSVEVNAWPEQQLEHHEKDQKSAERISNRPHVRTTHSCHSTNAPRPRLEPGDADHGHHHRHDDDLNELAGYAKRDNEQDGCQGRQGRNTEDKACPGSSTSEAGGILRRD